MFSSKKCRAQFLVLGVLTVAIGLVFVTCGSDRVAPESMEEYAQIVCTAPDPSKNRVTWGDFRSLVQKQIETMENVIPPAKVRDYHLSTLASWKLVLTMSRGKDKNAQYNEYELLPLDDSEFMLRMLALEEAVEEALDEMRYEPWEILFDAECFGF